ncbi:MAG: carbohydrate kinase [Thermosipho sp. (in: Bacteria)]|nr:carbohydrate kinase [Thermosipho sp. (in: thermotogales)]
MKILFLGEILIDLITDNNLYTSTNFSKKLGGSPLNIAINLSQLGVESRIISRIGSDPFGFFILESLKKYNIDTSLIQTDNEHNTTLVFVSKSKHTPDFFVVRGADRFFNLPDIDFKGVDYLHLSCWTITHEKNFENTMKLIKKAKNSGVKIGFDPNCRKKIFCDKKLDIDKIFEVLNNTFIIKPSLDDAHEIFGPLPEERYIELLHNFGIKYVILTLGKKGALVSDGNIIKHFPPLKTKVVDSTGAGDAFWSGVYFGLLNNWSIFKSSKLGIYLASIVLQETGAIVNFNNIKQYIKELENEN